MCDNQDAESVLQQPSGQFQCSIYLSSHLQHMRHVSRGTSRTTPSKLRSGKVPHAGHAALPRARHLWNQVHRVTPAPLPYVTPAPPPHTQICCPHTPRLRCSCRCVSGCTLEAARTASLRVSATIPLDPARLESTHHRKQLARYEGASSTTRRPPPTRRFQQGGG